jgi:hypothetical protein
MWTWKAQCSSMSQHQKPTFRAEWNRAVSLSHTVWYLVCYPSEACLWIHHRWHLLPNWIGWKVFQLVQTRGQIKNSVNVLYTTFSSLMMQQSHLLSGRTAASYRTLGYWCHDLRLTIIQKETQKTQTPPPHLTPNLATSNRTLYTMLCIWAPPSQTQPQWSD